MLLDLVLKRQLVDFSWWDSGIVDYQRDYDPTALPHKLKNPQY